MFTLSQHCLRALIAEQRVIELISRRDSGAIVGRLLRCASNGEIEKPIPVALDIDE